MKVLNGSTRSGPGRIYMGYYGVKVKRQVVNQVNFLIFPYLFFF
jgi:hypothetical protein